MTRRGAWNTLYKTMTWFQWGLGVTAAVMSASLGVDAGKIGQSWNAAGKVVSWIDAHAWILLFMLLGIGLVQLVRKLVGPPFVWETIHRLLHHVRDDVFGAHADPVQHHRVTLFKHVRWRWRWRFREDQPRRSGWLVPVERSGFTPWKTKVAFWVPPNDPDAAEGVAGRTWVTQKPCEVSSLPDLRNAPIDQNFEDYAKRTWVSVEWLRREPPDARSFYGIPVEIGGKPWGVVVLDSRRPNLIKGDKSFRLLATVLGKLLERT